MTAYIIDNMALSHPFEFYSGIMTTKDVTSVLKTYIIAAVQMSIETQHVLIY